MTIARILATKGREIVSMQPHDTLRDVVDVLAAKHIGAVVITDSSGTLRGILSERDVVRAIARHGADALEDPVSTYMTAQVVTTTEEESVLNVVTKMSHGRFRHVPVVKGDRLIGIVSVGDVVKFRLEQMEQEQSALREYIATA